MQTYVTKENWIEMFKGIGLSQEKMEQWHQLFESRYPEGHQSFLEWLGIPSDEIAIIRKESC